MPPTRPTAPVKTPFVNAMRLTARLWIAVLGLVGTIGILTPVLWKKFQHFAPGPDYRLPYSLSRDYWLYERRLEKIPADTVVVLGDSVIWGEYVRPDGTLPHFLNRQAGRPDAFANAGVNGLFPLALEGLVRAYASPLHHRRVIIHANVLWMSSPKADLQTTKEERFNHADLVPQFTPRIPCYRADLNQRLGVVIERGVPFLQWVSHLQAACFDQKTLLNWTLEDEGGDPPRRPNSWKNPIAQITLEVPTEPAADPERGPASARHKPWSTTGEGTARFEWVGLETSLQWAAFQRLIRLMQSRGNDVLVVIGPFNEHLMMPENRTGFRGVRDGIRDWLAQNRVPAVIPEILPSALYADASHPLTEGYERLAGELWNDPAFRRWLGGLEAPK